jgi:hypothetical protein
MYILKMEVSNPFQIQIYGICMLIMSKHTKLDRNEIKSYFPCFNLTEQYFQLLKTAYENLINGGCISIEIFKTQKEEVLEYNFHFGTKQQALLFKMRGLLNEP